MVLLNYSKKGIRGKTLEKKDFRKLDDINTQTFAKITKPLKKAKKKIKEKDVVDLVHKLRNVK